MNSKTWFAIALLLVPAVVTAPESVAKNWTVTSPQATPSTSFGLMRQLLSGIPATAPALRPQLKGSIPWVTGTAYAAGATVSNAGNVYVTIAGGTAGATPPTHITGSASDGTVAWVWQGKQTAPQLTGINATSQDGTLTKNWLAKDHVSESIGTGQVKWTGGVPQLNDAFPTFVGIVSVSVPVGVSACTFGTAATCTKNQVGPCIAFDFAGAKVQFGFFAVNNEVVQFRVNGTYIDSTWTITSGGAEKYATLDFTNVVSPVDYTEVTGRAINRIDVCWSNKTGIERVAIAPTSHITYPNAGQEWSIGVIGDSFSSGGGSLVSIQNSWPFQLRRYLNAPDVCVSGDGGTGFISTAGKYTYVQRGVINLQACNAYRPIKLIIVQGSTNDVGLSGISAAVTTLLTNLRGAFPSIPIFLSGVAQPPGVTVGNATTTEGLVFAGAPDLSDIYTIPVSTAAVPLFSGTGHVGATTGDGPNDFLIGATDTIHPSLAGQNALARWIGNFIATTSAMHP
jgi:lysophospholipase L1-like esterase